MENYVFLRSFVASILVPFNCLCFDPTPLILWVVSKRHTHTHTQNCHKIMICLCNANNTVGIEVLTSASNSCTWAFTQP